MYDKLKALLTVFLDATVVPYQVNDVVGVSGVGWGGPKIIPANGQVKCLHRIIENQPKVLVVDSVTYTERTDIVITETSTMASVQNALGASEYFLDYKTATLVFSLGDATRTIGEFTHWSWGQNNLGSYMFACNDALLDFFNSADEFYEELALAPYMQIVAFANTITELNTNKPVSNGYLIGFVGNVPYRPNAGKTAWEEWPTSVMPTFQISATSPVDEAKGVILTTDPVFTFNRAVNGPSVASAVQYKKVSDNTDITYTLLYQDVNGNAVLVDSKIIEKIVLQSADLPLDRFKVTIGNTVTDLYGNALSSPLVLDFQTLPDQAPTVPNTAYVVVTNVTSIGYTVQMLLANQPTDPDDENAIMTFNVADGTTGTIVATGVTQSQLNLGYHVSAANTQSTAENIYLQAVSSVSGAGPWSAAIAINIPSDLAPPAPDVADINITNATIDGYTVQILTANQPTDPDNPEAVITFDIAEDNTSTIVDTGITVAQMNAGYAVASPNPVGGDQNVYVRAVSSVSGAGAWSAAKIAPVPINSVPTASPTITGTATIGSTLTCNIGYADADGDLPGNHLYQWDRAGVNIGGATAATLDIVELDIGKTKGCTATPVALTGATPGTPVRSAIPIPVPAPPAILIAIGNTQNTISFTPNASLPSATYKAKRYANAGSPDAATVYANGTWVNSGNAITSPFVDGGLTNDTKYHYVLVMIVNGVESDPSLVVFGTPLADQVPPAANTANINITSITNAGFTIQILTANQPTDPDNPEATITFNVANDTTGSIVATGITSAQMNTGYAVTAANAPGETEDVFVRAVSSVSGAGAWSLAKQITIPDTVAPTAPVISFVSATLTTITIHLDSAATDDSGSVTYDAYKDGLLHAARITFDESLNYQYTGLSSGTSYDLVVKAKDNATPAPHETASNTTTTTTTHIVPTASTLGDPTVGNATATVAVTGVSTFYDGAILSTYNWYKRVTGQAEWVSDGTGASPHTYSGLTNDAPGYDFCCETVDNQGGVSAKSAVVSGVPSTNISRSSTGKIAFDDFEDGTLSPFTADATSSTLSIVTDGGSQRLKATRDATNAAIPNLTISPALAKPCYITYVMRNINLNSVGHLEMYSGTSGYRFGHSAETSQHIELGKYLSGSYSEITRIDNSMDTSDHHYCFKITSSGVFGYKDAINKNPSISSTNAEVAGSFDKLRMVCSGSASGDGAYFDNIVICNDYRITCTGVPTGYQLRIGGNNTYKATASSGTATVDCSGMSFPQSLVEILDASNNVVKTLALANDVWGGDAYAY